MFIFFILKINRDLYINNKNVLIYITIYDNINIGINIKLRRNNDVLCL